MGHYYFCSEYILRQKFGGYKTVIQNLFAIKLMNFTCQRKLRHIRVEIWFTKETESNIVQFIYEKHQILENQKYFGQ